MKINTTDGFEGCTKRALDRAKKLHRGETIKPEITISFEDPLAMMEILTPERLRLVQRIRTKSGSVSALAAALKRDQCGHVGDFVDRLNGGLVMLPGAWLLPNIQCPSRRNKQPERNGLPYQTSQYRLFFLQRS